MRKEEEKLTVIWRKYQKSKDYMDKKKLVKNTTRNWNFYIGKQWVGCETGGEELPVLNMIKPTIKYKTAVISQNKMTAKFSDMRSGAGNERVCEMLSKMFEESWEKSKMDSKVWEVIEGAAVQGDAYAFWSTGDTKQPPMILPNTSVFLGDENITDIQKQPYIMIVERLNVAQVKKIAKENGLKEDEIEMISADNNKDNVIVNQDEVTDKVTSILFMTKNEDGYVEIARSTKSVIYEKQEALVSKKGEDETIVGGLKTYPIVPYIWEQMPFTARGVSEVEQLIPNQIEINKTLARRSMTVKMTAYPRIAYDGTAIQNPEDLEKTGVAIEVNGGAQSVNQMISYLSTANISSDADKLQADLLNLTRDLAGAGDNATGNVNPEQASGQAIIAARDQAQIPLNKQVAQYQQFVEDVALLYFDLWTAYNTEGFEFEGEQFALEQVLSVKPSVRVDVSQDNAWTKLAEQQWADNIFERQQISFEEYVELCNSNAVPKAKLQAILEKRQAMQSQMQMQQPMVGPNGEPMGVPMGNPMPSGM